MDKLISEFVQQVPALGVLAFVVIAFLRHLSAREKHLDMMYHDAIEVIRENSQVIGEVKAALRALNGKSGG